MHTTLFSLIIFIGFMALLVGGFYADSYQTVTINPNTAGMGNNDSSFTLLTTGNAGNLGLSVPTCEWGRDIDIPVLGGLIWGGACITSYLGFLGQLMYIQTNVPWLQVILGGAICVIGYIIIRILRGGG